MKKLVFATLMCVAAMSAKAQVLTSETVNHVYEAVTNKNNAEFVFNAELTGNDITTMYVYKKNSNRKGVVTLKPQLKYEYCYASDGMLTSRTTYRWADSQNAWTCSSRYDYTLDNGKYCAEYSIYNHSANCFDQPVEKMVYFLMPYDSANYVSYYHRNYPTSPYHLVSETFIPSQATLLAEK